jgi:hypothetical protein
MGQILHRVVGTPTHKFLRFDTEQRRQCATNNGGRFSYATIKVPQWYAIQVSPEIIGINDTTLSAWRSQAGMMP